ncbi:MAG: hypothetical protein R3362_02760 [Rhodothermales bacterium]|nr:hypothetical protein [Rhodothermales bacterium]
MSSHRKSAAYIEAIVREAVSRVRRTVLRPLEAAGYAGPRSVFHLSEIQQDFLAGYIYGALQRLLELGELCEDEDVGRATHRLYCGLFGYDDNEYGPWYSWVVREGLHHLQRPHVFLGYCTGRNDVLAQLRFGGRRNALSDALRHLDEDEEGGGGALYGVG